MDKLSGLDSLVISQKHEWGEILTGFETKNKYAVLDGSGNELYMAIEEGGSTIFRMLLKALRPFEISVRDFDNQLLIRVARPFRFYFHQLNIYDSRGRLIGKVKRQFSILRRIYTVLDRAGNEIFQLFGPILHPWTFEVKKGNRQFGKITKKWTGFVKEGFTDADNFGISFPAELDKDKKAILLGAVFLIDFVHFENSGD